jgi:predicted nucleotidyltransferase
VKPEALAEKLHSVLGDRLRSVVLYGSAAAGDYVGKESDYNVLVVTTRLGVDELTELSGVSTAWGREGNPPPLYFTLDRLQKSADVFPIELLDIRESHRILFGDDIVTEIDVHPDHLRLILERELESMLIQLREQFLLTGGKARPVRKLMVDSLSTVLVLFRAALRL